MKKKQVGFHIDLDNTLVQSERLASEKGAWATMREFQAHQCAAKLQPERILCRRTGEPVDFNAFASSMAGVTMAQALRETAVALNADVDDETISRYDIMEQLKVTEAFCRELHAMPGALELLKGLKAHGGVSIVSSSVVYRMWVSLHSAGLIDQVDQIVSAQGYGFCAGRNGGWTAWRPPESWSRRCHSVAYYQGVSRPKPLPDSYILSCQELNPTGALSVAIEDSAGGMRAAVAAGISFRIGLVGPEIPAGDKPEYAQHLLDVGADEVVNSLDDAKAVILKWISQ